MNKSAFRSFMKDFPTLSKEFDLTWGRVSAGAKIPITPVEKSATH
jgi:hypothetical protein